MPDHHCVGFLSQRGLIDEAKEQIGESTKKNREEGHESALDSRISYAEALKMQLSRVVFTYHLNWDLATTIGGPTKKMKLKKK
ncbi:UNVERIFIED_CONTAM: hypothetical protein Sradi_6024100 [Sesamum radiatum]|uniref:Uncharacterized protein n=1 Tax=Sesamum radiatum TaxID=300843 RepID=A0AAW2KK25_SESRA